MIGKFCSFELSIFFLINHGFEFLICSLFDFRNAKGPSPINVTEMVQVHNYAVAYLGHKKFPPSPGAKSFWDQPSVIVAIKAKYVEYLKAIKYRAKLLKKTPRNNSKDTSVKTVVQEGLFKDFDTRFHYFSQTTENQEIPLAMDRALRKQYKKMSKEALENIDKSEEANIQHLAALAIIELQFMHGCGVDWRASGGGGLHDGNDGDDDDSDDSDKSSGSEKGGSGEDDEAVHFTKIDADSLLDEPLFEGLDYPDHENFLARRESLAMATLFFLSADLGHKFPKLKDQVHAGWHAKFKKPISMDQLLDPPSEILDAFKFTDDEDDWLQCTSQTLVMAMSLEMREECGINQQHLDKLGIHPPSPSAVSTNYSPSLCRNSSRLTLFAVAEGCPCLSSRTRTRSAERSATRGDERGVRQCDEKGRDAGRNAACGNVANRHGKHDQQREDIIDREVGRGRLDDQQNAEESHDDRHHAAAYTCRPCPPTPQLLQTPARAQQCSLLRVRAIRQRRHEQTQKQKHAPRWQTCVVARPKATLIHSVMAHSPSPAPKPLPTMNASLRADDLPARVCGNRSGFFPFRYWCSSSWRHLWEPPTHSSLEIFRRAPRAQRLTAWVSARVSCG